MTSEVLLSQIPTNVTIRVLWLTSFLTLGMARFSAFFIPSVVSSLRDVCSQFRNKAKLISASTTHI
jgi:hypothetical protein